MRDKIIVPDDIWVNALSEYCSSEISVRGLCKKYNLPYNQTLVRCRQEGWNEKKKLFLNESVDKSIDLLSDHVANNVLRAYKLCNKLMDKLDEVVDGMDAKNPTVLDDIKNVTYSMKNLKDIGYFKASLDEEEQMARIAKLRKEAQEEKQNNNIVVEFKGDIDAYSD